MVGQGEEDNMSLTRGGMEGIQGYRNLLTLSLFSSAVLIRGGSLLPALSGPLLRVCVGRDGCCEGTILTRGLTL